MVAPKEENDMRFGIFTSMGGQTWPGVLDFWRHLEASRWDIACVTDHFMPNTKEREGAMLESWSTLSALAALVPRMRVGTIVLGNTYRPPLDPKPVQTPQPELMIGGGGERVTLRIVAKHADHWNCWGGPRVLERKGKILDDHCSTLGRDPKTLKRSANMALLITDKKIEVDQLADTIAKRMGRHAADARDTCLAGTPDQIR